MTDVFAHIGARWRLLIGRRDRRPMQIQALILRYAVKPARNCMLTAQGSVRKEWLGEVSSTPEHVDLAFRQTLVPWAWFLPGAAPHPPP